MLTCYILCLCWASSPRVIIHPTTLECRKAGKDAQKLIVGRKGSRHEQRRKVEDQEQSTSIIHASPVPEWEVVMDRSRFPLSKERAPRGQAPWATSEQKLFMKKVNKLRHYKEGGSDVEGERAPELRKLWEWEMLRRCGGIFAVLGGEHSGWWLSQLF